MENDLRERHADCVRQLRKLTRQMGRQENGSGRRAKTRKTAEKWLRRLRPIERELDLPPSEWKWD